MQKMKNNIWKQAVVGISDGIIISLAFSTAIAFTYGDNRPVFITTLSIAILGGIVMSIGGFYAARFRMESLTIHSEEEQKQLEKEETEKTIALFKKLNLGEDMQNQAAFEIEKDSTEWKAFLQKNQQPFELPDKKQLPSSALIIGFSFFAGALLPLPAYLFIADIHKAIQYAVAATLILLSIVGYIKSSINGEHKLWGSARLLLLGAVATACTCWVAKIFIT